MAKLSKEEVEEIIERDLPDFQVVKESLDRAETDSPDAERIRDSSRPNISDATSPDLNTLREKLRRRSRSVDARRTSASKEFSRDFQEFSLDTDDTDDVQTADQDDTTDDVIVAVKPKKSQSPFDAGYRTKAVVISGRSKKVIGRQG